MKMRGRLLILGAFFVMLIGASAGVYTQSVILHEPTVQAPAVGLVNSALLRTPASTPPPMGNQPDPTLYDEQIGMTFTQSFYSIAYNVTAVKQSDRISGMGPAYLLNGLSNTGYWYQVGLAWNWNPGHYPGTGFDMVYEVWDPSGNSIFPTNGGAGLKSFNGVVNEGDTVLLNLYFSNTYGVVMLVKDYNTGAYAFETYSAEGGSYFVGLQGRPANSNGYFTGLMTEWYHSAPFYSNISPVIYSTNFPLTSAWMWIDEFSCPDISCSNRATLFFDSTMGPVYYSNPHQLQKFSSHGATEYSDAYRLITGPAYYTLTVSYSVNGGGSGYTQPLFTYTYNGITQSVMLTQFPSTYNVDVDSTWSVSGALGGSSQTERWVLISPQANGIVTSSETLNFIYQHQYRLIVTGGSGGSNGDGWYNSGSIASASSFGVFGRSAGSGQRVISYSIDGVTTQVTPTTGLISTSITMNSSHQVVFNSIQQFQVSIDSGASSALNSITPPTIAGDQYWYDSGSQVSLFLNGVWGRASGMGFRLVSYSVNGGVATQVDTLGRIVVLSINSISAPQSVTTITSIQYQLIIPTDIVASVTPPTIVGDTGWYDSGTSITVTFYSVWNVVPLQSRVVATSYNVNGGISSTLASLGNGTFVVKLIMNSPQTVNVKSITQYYVSFKYTDASGTRAIVPTSLQISVNDQTLEVNGSSIWLDNGTVFTISRLIYEGVDVKPTPQTEFSVSKPSVVTLRALVYDASIKVTDFLGLPASGAQVSMTLANRTTITGTTNGDGIFSASSIPLGNFTVRVSSIGLTTQLSGDASKQSVTPVHVLFSNSSLTLIAVLVVVAITASILLFRRRSKGDTNTLRSPQPSGVGSSFL